MYEDKFTKILYVISSIIMIFVLGLLVGNILKDDLFTLALIISLSVSMLIFLIGICYSIVKSLLDLKKINKKLDNVNKN